jgi:hypothetical protein
MTGVVLDSINRPRQNAVKVFFMVATNLVGDLIAVFHFQSLICMAIGSVLFTIIGIVLGMYFLNREIPIEYRRLWSEGIRFYEKLFRKFIRERRPGIATAVQPLCR